jgi:hypothetical protein
MTRSPILFAIAAWLLLVSPVRAQTSAEDRAAADALYEESGALIKAGRFADACPKLETSQRLDPGIGTLLRLGYCYEQVGRTASSWSAYNDAEALARKANDKRADDAAGRAKALGPKLSRLVITPKSPAPGQEVRRDGKPMDAGLWGTAVPVDPGEHVIESSAPGMHPWKASARVEAVAGTTTIAIPELLAGMEPPKEAPAPPYWNGQRIGGVVVGSAGIAGVIVSAALGVVTMSKNNSSKQQCSPADPNFCNATGVALRADAITAGNGSTAAIVAGGVLLAGGIVLFATAPSPKSKEAARVEIVPGIGALAFRGRF